jgi:hypothetical protein
MGNVEVLLMKVVFAFMLGNLFGVVTMALLFAARD